MQAFFNKHRDNFRKNQARERSLDRPLEKISRVLWPYPEVKLIFYVCVLAVLDFLSTFVALALSGDNRISEAGLIAKWALQTGGFFKLLAVDAAVISGLILLAIGSKFIYTKLGLKGFGRAAFAFMLVPYFIFIMGVVVNNVVVVFM